MNKFERKEFEVSLLGYLYSDLENRKGWYADVIDTNTGEVITQADEEDKERIQIICELQAKLEKML